MVNKEKLVASIKEHITFTQRGGVSVIDNLPYSLGVEVGLTIELNKILAGDYDTDEEVPVEVGSDV